MSSSKKHAQRSKRSSRAYKPFVMFEAKARLKKAKKQGG